MKERAERDCSLTSVVGSKSVHKKGEAQAPALDSYWSKKAISKRFLSMPAVCKYSVLYSTLFLACYCLLSGT